jgi:putative iron-only hydrogenase system regulator
MDTRVAVISIIVEKEASVEPLNQLLHEYASFVIGRLGIPYGKKAVNIICIAVDAPVDEINALTGALGRLDGITAKAAISTT